MRSCDDLLVVVGDRADEVVALLPDGVRFVHNPEHDGGMGSSLRLGLAAVPKVADAALVMLVDLPDVGAAVVDRVIAAARSADHLSEMLARAVYRGEPGHPVLFGRSHFTDIGGAAAGDRGARDYLAAHPVVRIECGDLAGGADVDRPWPETTRDYHR
jgi:CTP:molybdopterin cytidylyltransferase MocA